MLKIKANKCNTKNATRENELYETFAIVYISHVRPLYVFIRPYGTFYHSGYMYANIRQVFNSEPCHSTVSVYHGTIKSRQGYNII